MTDEGRRADLEHGTIPRLLRASAARFGAREALVDGGRAWTFTGLRDAAQRAARGLLALGFAKGERAAIWAPNVGEWVVAALAIHAAGGVLVPINTRWKGPEAAHVLVASGARVLFTVTDFLDADYVGWARSAVPPALGSIVVLRGAAPAGALAWNTFLEGGERVPEAEAEARALAVAPDDLCDLLFTSGTTGRPKGVMCTHAQTLRAYGDWAAAVGLRVGDRYLVVLPFFHSFGYKAGWLASLLVGATVLPQLTFDVAAVLARVARDRISVLPGPPSLYQAILAWPDLAAHDLSSLRLAVTGAAVIPVELIHRMRRELTFETIITGYGLTESGGVVTMCREGDDPETIARTSGRAIPGVEVKVADEGGRELPRGSPGEIRVRGYNVMRGYLDDPGETTAAIDAEGWLHTGDVGVMDARGYLRITDRTKDLFIVGGFNAYPAEIEAALLEHPAVVEAAVVGAPDERLGEVGVAFVVLRAGAALEPADLIAWSRERMANYKVPRRVTIVAALPKNATGKVLKYALREGARGAEERA